MQIIAMLTMLIDHIGYIFFPGELGWRYIGRIAFPIYCYALVQGHIHTKSRPRYLRRLFLIALIAQIPYNLALDPGGWNVVFTLLLSAVVLVILDKLPSLWLGIPVVLAAIFLMDYFPVDYNAYGLILVLFFRYARSYWLIAGHFLLNGFYLFYSGWLVQLFSIVPTIFIALTPGVWGFLEKKRLPRWVWWSFYPAHLAVLAAVKILTSKEWVTIEW
ncbi:TraX family protein [Paenibacillus tianjinensis]|uniref:Conjugal transfer protein TraX n=1 Tax=Paenibacillus tianjinensis TaxID=2810347 RepID=A0ABX7LG47_9BACL|nr:TraX family protein [Paenibacillus tianjinensis]QSF47082.1 conjugal transfer protein TraX [Paenibacillus tianjinensis]